MIAQSHEIDGNDDFVNIDIVENCSEYKSPKIKGFGTNGLHNTRSETTRIKNDNHFIEYIKHDKGESELPMPDSKRLHKDSHKFRTENNSSNYTNKKSNSQNF